MSGGDALGMIETRGYVGMLEAADAALKSAEVRIVSRQKVDAGLVTLMLKGDVASVQVAVDSGAAAARRVGELVCAHVIARPDESVARLEQVLASPSSVRHPRRQNRRQNQ